MTFNNNLVTLSNVDINVDIIYNISKVTLTQTFINKNNENVEAEYTFPVYTDASMIKCEFNSGNAKIICKIEEKDESKSIYKQALDDGQQSVMINKNSEIMTMNIANLVSNEPIIVKLEYVSRCIEEFTNNDNTFRFILPMTISQKKIYF